MMKPRDITIKTVLNGWIVQVGCQHLVFTSLDVMLKDLTAYLEDPKGTEDKYQAEAVNAELFNFAETVAVADEMEFLCDPCARENSP